jgi:hypothetical protein
MLKAILDLTLQIDSESEPFNIDDGQALQALP